MSAAPSSWSLRAWVVLALLGFVTAGFAAYHYGKRDYTRHDRAQLQVLSTQPLVVHHAPSNDWPQWRGPQRDGVSTEIGLLAQWPSGGPPLLWENPIGEGHASIAVAKERLFTMLRQGEREAVVCWDARTGNEIWRCEYPCDYQNDHGSGPRSTPAVDGDCVYAVGANGMMHCLKAFTDQPGGEIVWKKDLSREFHAETPKWGVSFSPLVEGDRVFIQPGGPNGGSLAALDKRTGKILWSQCDDPASYSSPIAATLHGERQMLFFTANRLVSLDPGTGSQLWDYAWPSDQQCNIATPIVVHDYVFISSGYGPGCAVLKINKANDTWSAALVYSHRRMRNHFSICVRHDDCLYGFDHGVLTCMNFRTGEIRWKTRGFDKGSLLLVNDRLIVYGETGILAMAEATPEAYRETARFEFATQGPCWSVPVIANGRLYVRAPNKLACFDVRAAAR
jgi:outer membrane protein assembly factor BamB